MKILIADDHDLLRDTLKNYLEAVGGFDVQLAADVDGAVEVMEREGPFELIMLDVSMPGMNGFSGLDRMIGKAGDTPVAVMSGTAPPQTAQQALEHGAIGYLPKTMAARSLASAMRLMACGERYVPVDIAMSAAKAEENADGPLDAVLTQRERHVLTGLCEGKANKEIARDLGLREPTIKLHVKTICRKLEARNRTHAAMLAKESGFA